MTLLTYTSFDNIMSSLLVCLILRQAMIVILPDRVAGPGGWLINTGEEEA